MTTRVLPIEEWPRLKGTEAEQLWPVLDPSKSTIVVVEDEGIVVGCHVLMYVLHAECLWVHPEYRTKGVMRMLWTTVQRMVRAAGVRSLVTACTSDRVKRMLTYAKATRLPGSHWVIPMGDR